MDIKKKFFSKGYIKIELILTCVATGSRIDSIVLVWKEEGIFAKIDRTYFFRYFYV